MDNNIESLLCELERASMCSDNSSYNDITEKQSSESYRLKIENLYANAVSDLYELNDSQRAIVRKRIDEVRDKQKHFNIPIKETVDALLRDYNAQPDGKRNKSLLDDYRYCTFVLECVSIQKNYLERFASLVSVENRQETIIDIETDKETDAVPNSETSINALKGCERITIKEAIEAYRLPTTIKDPKWRIKNEFPTKGFEDTRQRKEGVRFFKKDVEEWIKSNKKKRK